MTGPLLLEHSLDAVLLTAPDGRILSANAAACQMFGRSEEAICSLGRAGIMDTADPRLAAAIEERELTGRFFGELTGLRADGTPFPVELSTAEFTDSAGQSRTSMVIRDITHRKVQEEELRLTKERLEVALAGAELGAYDIDRAARHAVVDRRYLEMLGYGPGEVVITRELLRSWIHPDDIAKVDRAFGAYLAGETPAFDLEYRVRHRDGHWLWIRDRGWVTARDTDGTPRRVVGTHLDVTDLKRGHAELHDALAWQQAIFEGSRDAVFISDERARFTAVNSAAERLTGYSREELLAMSIPDLHDAADLRAFETFHARILAGEEVLSEAPIRRRDGTRVEAEFNNSAIVIGGRRFMHTVARDIRERKVAEMALRVSEERHRALVELSPDAIMIDVGGRLVFANEGAARLLGAGSSERLIGLPVMDLVHPDYREIVRDRVRTATDGGRSAPLIEERFLRLDGSEVEVEVTASPFTYLGERGVQVVAREIGERKRVERERELLLERVRGLAIRLTHADEAQRTRLARDLHDSVGQNLSALGLTLSIARSQLSPSALAAVGPRLDDAEALLGASVRQVRDVMAELRPPALDELGLAAALHSYGEQLERRTGTVVAVVGREPDPRLPAKAEIAVFRIAQEALTNVAKHARARHVEVRIDQGESAVAVLVEDDGAGFDMRARGSGQAGSGWGLMGMRERAEGIGATVSVDSSPGRGTRVIVTVPR